MKLKNEIFAFVLDWLIKNKGIDGQKGLSQKTGISQNTISRIMTGKVEPSDDTLRKLNLAFGGIFNMNYLRGNSSVMLLENEMYYSQHLGEHPFFEKKESSSQLPDMSSVFNSALAAKDDAIESLKRELRTKDELIQSLHEQLATKDQLIAEQKARLVDYRRLIDSHEIENSYPFPVGVADGSTSKNVHNFSNVSPNKTRKR